MLHFTFDPYSHRLLSIIRSCVCDRSRWCGDFHLGDTPRCLGEKLRPRDGDSHSPNWSSDEYHQHSNGEDLRNKQCQVICGVFVTHTCHCNRKAIISCSVCVYKVKKTFTIISLQTFNIHQYIKTTMIYLESLASCLPIDTKFVHFGPLAAEKWV